jgi:hypothetical protein
MDAISTGRHCRQIFAIARNKLEPLRMQRQEAHYHFELALELLA